MKLYLVLPLFLLACDPSADVDTDTDTDTDADTAGEDTWTSFASTFSQSYCVECHDSSPKDFSIYDDFVEFAETSRCGVATTAQEDCGSWPPPLQFPVGNGPQPTDEERDALVAWIDAGMPE